MKNRKWIGWMLGAAMLAGGMSVQAKNITIYIDGDRLVSDKQPFVEENLTYVPVRAISEALGAKVTWDKGYVDINIQDLVCAGCQIGSKKGYTRDKELTLDGAARIKNGTTYVPLRFVGEALGAGVDYRSGSIYINSKGVEAKISAIQQEMADDEQKAYVDWAASDPHNTQNALYWGTGQYDASSNKWIYVLDGKIEKDQSSVYQQTVIYDVANDSWSRMSEEAALEKSVYAQYLCPGDIEYKRDYKNNTVVEDFDYEYNENYSDAVFQISFSEQNAAYYLATGMFKVGAEGGINCIKKPMSDEAAFELAEYKYKKADITQASNEPKMPQLPADLVIDKLPVTTFSLKTTYHAKLTAGNKSKEIAVAYRMDDQDFVPLKDVQSLVSGITFEQTAAGERHISYHQKTISLTKEQYRVLFGSNKLMISTKILKELGAAVQLVYIS